MVIKKLQLNGLITEEVRVRFLFFLFFTKYSVFYFLKMKYGVRKAEKIILLIFRGKT